MTKTEKTFSTRSNAKRAIASFRDKNPDLTGVGVSVVPAGDKFAVHATGWENAHVAAIDAAGFVRDRGARGQRREGPRLGRAGGGARRRAQLPKAKKRAAAAEAAKRAPVKAAKAAYPKAKGNGARKAAKPANGERGPTKTDQGLDMLRRKNGVTVAEMGEAFGWRRIRLAPGSRRRPARSWATPSRRRSSRAAAASTASPAEPKIPGADA